VCVRSTVSTAFSYYDGHNHPVTVARFSPNGEKVASGDCEGNLHIWLCIEGKDHIVKLETVPFSGKI
ncbi:hypothetical protein KIPB_015910, partial [Kipferlia bialata]